MAGPILHWRYLGNEGLYRWKRTLLTVAGIALAVSLVTLLDVLGRSFIDVSTVPFKNIGADLLVQRSVTKDSVPAQMGVMVPFSAQPITSGELARLGREHGVGAARGFVLLWNFGTGRFFSISGLDFAASPPLLGPDKVRDWLYKGRMPAPGSHEILVERHYGAFYKIKPGKPVTLGGQTFTVTGAVDLQRAGRFVASNFYMDIGVARQLARLPQNIVNQVFLKVSDINQTEAVKKQIASWLPKASIVSSGSMLKLFGGISQVIGRFHIIALLGGGAAAFALVVMLIFGTMTERKKDLAILRTLGWTRTQARRQLVGEMTVQGLIGGLLALVLVGLAALLLRHVTLTLPASLGGENPIGFAKGAFQAPAQSIALPIKVTAWDWLVPPLMAALVCAVVAWVLSARATAGSLWQAVKH